MRQGRFFSLPERPDDVDRLRAAGSSLDAASRPPWLDDGGESQYRLVASVRLEGQDAGRGELEGEIAELEACGLAVWVDNASRTARLYVSAEPSYPLFSIGIYGGDSLWSLRPEVGVSNPVLTRDHVSDVAAVFVADPFMVRRRGQWFMFFEVLNWRENKGEIGLATSPDGLRWSYQGRVLVEPFHLSYPYVFESEGSCYMMPETRQKDAVRLYRALEFPAGWTLEATLLSGVSLADVSVFRARDRWWMLAGSDGERRHDTLRLFGAGDLRGPWTEHPRSPIVRGDPEIARPAGRVLAGDDRILRFSQSCHPEYGLDVRAFEIVELTAETYGERAVGPGKLLSGSGVGWNESGMHHIDAHRLEDGTWLACVDGWRRSV